MQKFLIFVLAIAIVSGTLLLMSNSLLPIHFEATQPTKQTIETNRATVVPRYEQNEVTELKNSANSTGIQKCTSNGKTTYSDAPCPNGTKTSSVEMHVAAGIVSPSRETIEATRAQIRNDIRNDVGPSGIIQTTAPDQETCDWLKKRADQLDSQSRHRQSSWSQDQIRFEKQRVRDQQFRTQCN
jgi:hypothetical protein